MKLYRVTLVLAVMLLPWTTFKAVADDAPDYAYCSPYCIAFLGIDNDWYAVAVDQTGRYKGLTMMDPRTGRMLVESGMAPVTPGHGQMSMIRGWVFDPNLGFGENYSGNYAGSCEGSIVAESDIIDTTETDTHYIVLIKTTFTCSSSGNTLHAVYTTVKYEK